MNSNSLSDQGEWSDPDGTALADLSRTLTQASLAKPVVPKSVIPLLRSSLDGWAWSSDHTLDSIAVYSIVGEAGPSSLEACLSPERANFWMFGHRGHGVNSYAIGLVARVGPLFIAQQHGWGGAYMGSDEGALVDSATKTWNKTLNSLDGFEDEKLHVAVLFSNYRDYAVLLVHDPSSTSSPASTDLPLGWSPLYNDDQHDISTLQDLHFVDEPAIALGAAHLSSLMAADNRFVRDQ